MKSLIFDIDGTLWDSRAIVAKGYNDYLLEIGRPDLQVDAEYLKTLFGKTMTEIADIMLDSIPVPQRYDVMLGCMDREDEFLHEDPCDIAFPVSRKLWKSSGKTTASSSSATPSAATRS